MSDQNIALLNTIDAIDDATMETEMEVLVSMESYYEKCIKTLSYMQHDESIEPLEIFVESAFTDKVKNLGSRVENWAKSETKGGRVKKILVGLVKKLSLFVLKVVRGIKNLIQRVSKGFVHMLSVSVKRFDSFLDDAVARMDDTNINEYYIEEDVIQEGMLSAVALNILANTGRKAINEIKNRNIDDNDILHKKESLALKIRKIDKMDQKEKAQLISNVNKMIDKYCETAKEVSDRVIDEISDKVCEELDKRNPNETGPEMLDRLNVFLEKMSDSISTALSGVVKGGITVAKAGKQIANDLGITEAQVKKITKMMASSGAKVMTLANSINNSEVAGSETAKALIEILTRRNTMARVIRIAKGLFKDQDNPKIFMTDKETAEYYNKYNAKKSIEVGNEWDMEDTLTKHFEAPGLMMGDPEAASKIFKARSEFTPKDISEFNNEIDKICDEIDSYISRKLKITTRRQKKLRNMRNEFNDTKNKIINRNNENIQDAKEGKEEYQKFMDDLDADFAEHKDFYETHPDWAEFNKERRDRYSQNVSYSQKVIDFAERSNTELANLKLKWDIVEDSELDSKYVSLRDELTESSEEIGNMIYDIFDSEHKMFQGTTAKETVKIIAGSFKKFNKKFLNYHAYTAKHVMKQIIQLESIEGSLAELGQMVSKYGDLLVQGSQMTKEEINTHSDEYVLTNSISKFIGSIAKVTGFCMTKCISNPTASKKLMDKTIAASIRYLDAELTAEEYSKKIERRDDL